MKLDTKGLLWIKLFRKLRLTVTEWLKYSFPVNGLLLTKAVHAQDSSSSKGIVTWPLQARATEYQHNFPRSICCICITNGTNSSMFSASQKAWGIVFAGSWWAVHRVTHLAGGWFTRSRSVHPWSPLCFILPAHTAPRSPGSSSSPLSSPALLLSQC